MREFLENRGLDERSVMLVVGVCAVALAGLLIAIGKYLGLAFSKPFVELLLFLLLALSFPESQGRSWRLSSVTSFVLLGVFLGLVWVFLFGFSSIDETEFKRVNSFPLSAVIYGMSASLVTAPLFEEKVVRHLILGGMGMINPFVASSLVSLAFALTHVDSVVWAFIASMFLCFMALRLRMTSIQRAISHGVCNFLITTWYYTDAYGIWQS